MGSEDMITKAGELAQHLLAAAQQGCQPGMDIRVRIGTLQGTPEYRINCLKGINNDARGPYLLVELCAIPESGG
jgi:hypothetical protein